MTVSSDGSLSTLKKVFPKCFSTASRCRASSAGAHLDSSSLDDVGLSWPPDRRRPSWQQHWECPLPEHILHHHEPPRGVCLQRPGWWQPGDAVARPLTHEEIAHTCTPCAPRSHSNHPSRCTRRRRAHQQHGKTPQGRRPTVRDWFIDMSQQWTERQWRIPRCLG